MVEAEIMALAMVIATFAVLLAGFPAAFTLSGTALIFAGLGSILGVFDDAFLGAVPQRIFGVMTNEILIAIPLFIFMGVMLERSKVADDLLESLGRLFGPLRGGLGISVVLVGGLLAASTGIVGATVVTMGLLSLPTMLRWNYDPGLASGLIVSSGTLGQIIPPSIILVLLGDVVSASYQHVQLKQQIFSPEVVSVSDLFAGALLPGLLLVALFVAFLVIVAWLKPALAPAVANDGAGMPGPWQLIRVVLPPVLLVVAVLGSILAGIATPTESAAVGAVGTIMLAGLRVTGKRSPTILTAIVALVFIFLLTSVADLRMSRSVISSAEFAAIGAVILACGAFFFGLALSLVRIYRAGLLEEAMRSTATTTGMVFVIIISAGVFAIVFRGFGGDDMVERFLTDLPGGKWGSLLIVMGIMFLLGFFLDAIEIIYVVVPIVAPALLLLGVDPVWLAVLLALNLQTSYLTPPFGLALFFLRGVAPPSLKTIDIYRGIVPFIILQLICLAIVASVPELATWLPRVIFGS